MTVGDRGATEWILWTGTVGGAVPVEERLVAAHAAGCGYLSLSPADVASGEVAEAQELGARCRAAAGVAPGVLDGVTTWLPSPAPRRRPAPSADVVLALAAAIGVRSVNALAMRPTELSLAEVAGHFAALCDRAADHGLAIHAEFAPGSAVGDLAVAWEVVERAGRANGGILFDTWHFFRGPVGVAGIGAVPGDRILAVQVSDGGPPAAATYIEDTLHHRRLPGDGDFDLHGAMAALAATGGLGLVGPEVFSDELHALPATTAATLAMERTRALLLPA